VSDQDQGQSQPPISGPLPMSGRVALVAGASKGIGAATAEAFAAAGAAVVLAARDTAALKAVAAGIEARGGQALAVGADVADADSMRHLVEAALSAFGRLDAAFNNASAGPMPAPLADIDPDEFDLGIATNIRGTFLGMKFQIPAMLASGGGAIVNMASIAGLNGTANLAAYVAGKAGIIGLTKVAALDYADQGIRVNVVAPGPILTYHLEAAGPQAQRGAALSTPMRRVGAAAEVARAVLWLCLEESSFITGTVIPVDGGQSAGNKPPQMYITAGSAARPRLARAGQLLGVSASPGADRGLRQRAVDPERELRADGAAHRRGVCPGTAGLLRADAPVHRSADAAPGPGGRRPARCQVRAGRAAVTAPEDSATRRRQAAIGRQ